MIHYIIVKFNDTVTDKQAMCLQIEALFLPAAKMPGIHSVQLHTTCIDRPNRHDLMIQMEMEPDALEAFDHSAIHQTWKAQFGQFVESKTIFDHM